MDLYAIAQEVKEKKWKRNADYARIQFIFVVAVICFLFALKNILYVYNMCNLRVGIIHSLSHSKQHNKHDIQP